MNQFKPSRKPMIGVFALLASLSAPLAFAQSTDAAAPQAAPPAEQAAAAPAAAPQKKSWSDVDLDKDGKLTKTEAAAVPALGKVFDQADGNADGALTTDEYKNYVVQVQARKGSAGGG
ncbi:hypothetical protein J2X06_002548 [Lysobacter niastensis]|uniref:EF-hand domain-containing protein n=1 Tax=Lysobacter niastensis TaxID=380629 RepID=A0ABU1WD56_9GAMM|nr:EF-hand domain-containing protein [Lysobacter niastensis]MDR7135339.1 hypothetical protein [Lysobacter niastensis]